MGIVLSLIIGLALGYMWRSYLAEKKHKPLSPEPFRHRRPMSQVVPTETPTLVSTPRYSVPAATRQQIDEMRRKQDDSLMLMNLQHYGAGVQSYSGHDKFGDGSEGAFGGGGSSSNFDSSDCGSSDSGGDSGGCDGGGD